MVIVDTSYLSLLVHLGTLAEKLIQQRDAFRHSKLPWRVLAKGHWLNFRKIFKAVTFYKYISSLALGKNCPLSLCTGITLTVRFLPSRVFCWLKTNNQYHVRGTLWVRRQFLQGPLWTSLYLKRKKKNKRQ
jgi:hypothetical protein